MTGLHIIWDSPDDPIDNYAHIFERHEVTHAEVEAVLHAPGSRSINGSTGWPICFGWTSTGKYIAVVSEEIDTDPQVVHTITAYPVPAPGA